MTQRDSFSPPPAIQISVTRLVCTGCGAEANATCSCGVHYVPVQQRVAEYDAAKPGQSTRQAAADLGVDHSTVVRARRGASAPPETVTGRDSKTYPATKPKRQTYEPEPGEDDLIDFIVEHFERLSFQAQTRCTVRLNKIIDGRAS